MSKREELNTLDDNVRRIMLEATKPDGDTSVLGDLTVVTNYLAKNMVLAEKEKQVDEVAVEARREAKAKLQAKTQAAKRKADNSGL